MAYAQLNDFLTRARNASRTDGNTFNERTSSLRALIGLLRQTPNVGAAQIAAEITRIPANKQTIYRDALDSLRTNYPGLAALTGGGRPAVSSPAPGPMLQDIASAAAARVQDRTLQARLRSAYLTRKVAQRMRDRDPGTGQYNGSFTDYAPWGVKMKFEESRTVLTVAVPIRYRAKPGDADGHAPTQLERETWAHTIRSAWNGAQFQVSASGVTRTLDVQFTVEFIDWDSSLGTDAYEVDVVNIPIERALLERGRARGIVTDAQPLQNQNWRVRAELATETLDGSSLGTPHLGQWGIHDRQAIVHEFGHAIGNPDEYDCVRFTVGTTATDCTGSAIYDQAPFTTSSVMNDTRAGTVRKRHYALIADLYKVFYTAQNGGVTATVTVKGVPD